MASDKTDQELIDEWLQSHKPTALPDRSAREVGNSTPGWRHEKAKRDEARDAGKARKTINPAAASVLASHLRCPACGAAADEKCHGVQGEILPRMHFQRRQFAASIRAGTVPMPKRLLPKKARKPIATPTTAEAWLRQNDPNHGKAKRKKSRADRLSAQYAADHPQAVAANRAAIFRGKKRLS